MLYWLNLFFQWVTGLQNLKFRREVQCINKQHGDHCLQSIINHLSGFLLILCLLNDVSAPVWELSHVCVLTCKLVSQSLWIIAVICESETAVVLFWLIIFNPVEARHLGVTPLNLLVLYSRCHAYVANTHERQINTDLPTATRKWSRPLTPQWICVQQANSGLKIYSPAEYTVSKGFALLFVCLVQTQTCQGHMKTECRWISRVGPVNDRQVEKWTTPQSLPHMC